MASDYTKEQGQIIRKLAEEGFPDRGIAEYLTQAGRKCTREAIYSYRVYHQIKSNYKPKKKSKDSGYNQNSIRARERQERIRQAKEMFKEGAEKSRIADVLGVNRNTINKYLKIGPGRSIACGKPSNPFSSWKPTCLS